MTSDAANPFQKLAEEFAARTAKKAGASFSRKCGPAALLQAAKGRTRALGGAAPEEEVDAALFLDAVSRSCPLGSGKRGHAAKKRSEKAAHGSGAKLSHAFDRARDSHGRAARAEHAAPPAVNGPANTGPLPGSAPAGHRLPQKSKTARSPRHEETEDNFAALLEASQRGSSAPDAEEEALFAKAMQGVDPVRAKGRSVTAPVARSVDATPPDPAKALRDLLEGRVEFALRHTDEYMEGFVTGVDPLVLARLRNGQYSPESHVDLHGKNARQAYEALTWFIKNAYQRGMRTVVVVTGRGRNSPDGVGVLRMLLQRWFCREPFKRVVLAFCTAKAGDGGPGAVYVLLRKYKKSRGKIIWEQGLADEEFPDC